MRTAQELRSITKSIQEKQKEAFEAERQQDSEAIVTKAEIAAKNGESFILFESPSYTRTCTILEESGYLVKNDTRSTLKILSW